MKIASYSKALLVAVTLVLAVPARPLAQQGPPPLQPLLQQMLTGNLAQRENAFYTIKAIPHAASRPEVQRVFVEVLQREDGFMNSSAFNGSLGPAYGEGYAEYTSGIGELVWRYARLTNSEDRATLLALVDSPGVLPSAIGNWLATRTALSITDLQGIESLPRLRSDALHGLAKFLNAARAGKRTMTPEHALEAKQAIVDALKSPSAGERYEALLSIEHLRDPDDAHYLAAMTSDPDPSIRKQARFGAAGLAKLPPVHHIAH